MDVSLFRKWIVEFIGAPRTPLLGIVTLATLLCSGCANGGGGERGHYGASFISTAGQRQDSFGMGDAAQNSAIVDWTKPAKDQPGETYPLYDGIGTP